MFHSASLADGAPQREAVFYGEGYEAGFQFFVNLALDARVHRFEKAKRPIEPRIKSEGDDFCLGCCLLILLCGKACVRAFGRESLSGR